MSRNLHLWAAKSWRMRRPERTAWVDLTLDTSRFRAAIAMFDAIHRAHRVEANLAAIRAVAADEPTPLAPSTSRSNPQAGSVGAADEIPEHRRCDQGCKQQMNEGDHCFSCREPWPCSAAGEQEARTVHDWNRMLICRRCGIGLNAGDLIDGERPCMPRSADEQEAGR